MNRPNAYLVLTLLLALSGCGAGNNAASGNNTGGAAQTQSHEEAAKRRKWAAESLAQAEKDYNATDFSAGARAAHEAIQFEPNDPRPWELLARCEEKLGNHQPARDAYRRAANLSAGATRTALFELAARCSQLLAERAFNAGQFKPAQEHALDALRINEGNAEARRVLANALLKRGEYAEARTEYRRIADESTGATRQDNLYWTGICGLYLFEYEAAEQVFQGLIKEGYKGGDIYLWRGRCRFERKDIEGARQDFRLAIEFATSPDQRQAAQDALMELDKPGKSE